MQVSGNNFISRKLTKIIYKSVYYLRFLLSI